MSLYQKDIAETWSTVMEDLIARGDFDRQVADDCFYMGALTTLNALGQAMKSGSKEDLRLELDNISAEMASVKQRLFARIEQLSASTTIN